MDQDRISNSHQSSLNNFNGHDVRRNTGIPSQTNTQLNQSSGQAFQIHSQFFNQHPGMFRPANASQSTSSLQSAVFNSSLAGNHQPPGKTSVGSAHGSLRPHAYSSNNLAGSSLVYPSGPLGNAPQSLSSLNPSTVPFQDSSRPAHGLFPTANSVIGQASPPQFSVQPQPSATNPRLFPRPPPPSLDAPPHQPPYGKPLSTPNQQAGLATPDQLQYSAQTAVRPSNQSSTLPPLSGYGLPPSRVGMPTAAAGPYPIVTPCYQGNGLSAGAASTIPKNQYSSGPPPVNGFPSDVLQHVTSSIGPSPVWKPGDQGGTNASTYGHHQRALVETPRNPVAIANSPPPNGLPGYPTAAPASSPHGDNLAKPFSKLSMRENLQLVDLLDTRKRVIPMSYDPPTCNLLGNMVDLSCSPESLRCTMTALPCTSTLLQNLRIPLAVIIQPFRTAAPLLQYQLIRCRGCRSYLNPFVQTSDSKHWICNFCYRTNQYPAEAYTHPSGGQSMDPRMRPELTSGSIEFELSGDYSSRSPQPAVYLFLLDVSKDAVDSGYLQTVCTALREHLDDMPGDSRAQIGFITFSSRLHFYQLRENLSQPRMVVLHDLEDTTPLFPDGLLVHLKENKMMVLEFLRQLPVLFDKTQDSGCALGAAVDAAKHLLNRTGGRMSLFLGSLPNIEPGKLVVRDQQESLSKTLPSSTDFYKKQAIEFAQNYITVDSFIVASKYIDLASLSHLSRHCGGVVNYYHNFNTRTNPAASEKLSADLHRYLTRQANFETIVRIRCSHGIMPSLFLGNTFVHSLETLMIPVSSPDVGYMVKLEIDNNLEAHTTAAVQVVHLYTSCSGERRVRVDTLGLPVTDNIETLLSSVDQLAMACLVARMGVDKVLTCSLADTRDALLSSCADLLSVCQKELQQKNSGSSHLLVPKNLSMLAMLVHGLLRSEAFRISPGVPVDVRVHNMMMLMTLPVDIMVLLAYPVLFDLAQLQGEENASQHPLQALPCSSEQLSRSSLCLLDHGDGLTLMVSRLCPVDIIQLLFGVDSFQTIADFQYHLPELDNNFSRAVRSFIQKRQQARLAFYPPLMVIREDSRKKSRFFDRLIEDRSESTLSYIEFLQYLKKQVTK